MINFSFSLLNPFSDRFSPIYTNSGATGIAHKFWEFNVYGTNSIVDLRISYTVREDHAGLEIFMGFLGWSFEFRIYDNRHWDFKNMCWEVYE